MTYKRLSSLFALCFLIAQFSVAEVVSHWTFSRDSIDGTSIKDSAGSLDLKLEGGLLIESEIVPESLFLHHDRNYAYTETDLTQLPQDAVSVEAWVKIEKTVEWCGIISAVPVEGDSNAGWTLGFRQSSFTFGLTSQTNPGMTYARAQPSLDWGQWYHVVGTYDGEFQRLFVNGEKMAELTIHTGKIKYPEPGKVILNSIVKDGVLFDWWGYINEIKIHNNALTSEQVAGAYAGKKDLFPPLEELALSPLVTRLNREEVSVVWETAEPCPTYLMMGETFPLKQVYTNENETTRHEVVINGLENQRLYYFQVKAESADGKARYTRLFEYDSTFDYTPEPVVITGSPYPQDELTAYYEQLAQSIIETTGVQDGYCLVLGSEEGRLAFELAKRTKMQVIGVEDEDAKIEKSRRALDKAGVYGIQVSIHKGTLEKLPYPDYFANLIVSERLLLTGAMPTPAQEVYRVLRPSGGVAWLGQPDAPFKTLTNDSLKEWYTQTTIPELKIHESDGLWAIVERDVLPGSGSWTHQYGDAGNTSNSQDEIQELPVTVLWFGKPGPRPMVDRGTRSPAPLSINGRMFVQGDRRLFGLDAYNGTVLWTKELPNLRRANIPRDSSNMTAGPYHLFAAVDDACWVLDAQTGERVRVIKLPEYEQGRHDWGYISYTEGMLVGSSVVKGGLFIGADGEWYDAANEESHKVVSDSLFAYDPANGFKKWVHESEGLIINPTIASGDGKIFFAEVRDPNVVTDNPGRIKNERMSDLYLVALDMKTGEKLWERQTDLSEGRWVLYMTYSQGRLVAVSTTDKYHIFAFDAENGERVWNHDYEWYKDHHGGAMQHPVIVGSRVFAEPKVFDLTHGEDLGITMPKRDKCGTISASGTCLFYRDYWPGMWDLEKDIRVDWKGMRPGCWLNMIPANGIMLAPEASAGCYCDQPLQTSIAFTSKHE